MTATPPLPPARTDLLVVGGGLAGHCAALEAAESGAEVVLVEKEAKIGGATILSGGSFAFADTPLQRERGIADSPERLFRDLREVGGNANDVSLVQAYVDHQGETYGWLGARGVRFERLFAASGHSVPRGHSRNAQEVLDIIAEKARATGRVRTFLSTAARRLARSESDGRVTGARGDTHGRDWAIEARHGVVLATGGFSRNERLLQLFAPNQSGAQRMGGPGNTGDGLLMAWRAGAAFRDVGYIKGTFGNHPSAGPEDHFLLFPMYAGGIAVNAKGRRFVDESQSYKIIGDACLEQPGCIGWQVFDEPIFRCGQPGIPSMDFQADLAAGRVVKADTLVELSTKIGVDAGELAATVAHYNDGVRQGFDSEFGRRHQCSAHGALVPIATPPYYAFASKSVVLATYCGITVDAATRVRDVFGEAIRGLYAAGGVIGGFHGKAYMTGTANGKAAIFGRIAARTALEG